MKEKTYQIVSTVLLLFIVVSMMMIFFFSSQDSTRSSETSSKISNFVISVLYKDYDDLDNNERSAIKSKVDYIVRKGAHFTEFMFLSFVITIYAYLVIAHKKKNTFISFLISIPLGIIYAFIDEFHQKFVSGRAMMFRDVLIDSLGVLTGAIIGFLLFTLIRYCIIKRNRKLNKEEIRNE